MMTKEILFSISKLYYDMDYYSIIISSLAFKIFYGIMYFIDANKDNVEYLSDKEKLKQNKVFHIISHFIYLALTFNKNIQAGIISLNNGGLNSMSKFVINNFFEVIPKCQGIKEPYIIQKFQDPSLFQTKIKNKFYKCYCQNTIKEFGFGEEGNITNPNNDPELQRISTHDEENIMDITQTM